MNPGTIAEPWATIGKAANTLVAGDTAIIMDGTYTEAEIPFGNSGTASQRITFKAQNKHRAVLSSTSRCSPAMSIYGSYVTVEDIRFSVSPNNVHCPSYSATNSAVHCWQTSVPSPSNPSTGSVGCTIRGTLIDASPERDVGIKTRQDFALLENNEVHSELEAFNSYGNIFRNNLITTGGTHGGYLYGKGGVRNFEAYNNVILITSPDGIGLLLGGITENQYLYDPPSGVEAYNSVAFNNVVINQSGASADAVRILGMMGANDSAFTNNVTIGGYLFLMPGSTGIASNNPRFMNNITNCSGKDALGGLGEWNYTGSLTLDYNNFHECTSVPVQAHAIIGNPLFFDPQSDWHLTLGSPAIGSGIALMPFLGFSGEAIDVSKNKDGIPRPAAPSPWNLGVY